MTTIIRERYPVRNLPKDLQEAVGDVESVRLTIEADGAPRKRPSFRELQKRIERLHREGVIKPVTAEEAVARIRDLRDEWDD